MGKRAFNKWVRFRVREELSKSIILAAKQEEKRKSRELLEQPPTHCQLGQVKITA